LLADTGELERALCSRVVAAKGEVVEKGHTAEQAQYGRDALAKVGTFSCCITLEDSLEFGAQCEI